MKKVFISLFLILCLCLIGCRSTQESYETMIYCSHSRGSACNGTLDWNLREDSKIKTAYSIGMVDLTRDSYSPHYHYIVTYKISK